MNGSSASLASATLYSPFRDKQFVTGMQNRFYSINGEHN